MNTAIIYRNYSSKNRLYELKKIANNCKKNRIKLFVSNDLKLALKVKANGVYIPSFNKARKFSNLENKKLLILGSAHNQKEVREKIVQKCKIIFLSPLFRVKKSKKFLGLYKLNNLSINNKNVFFALGGISKKNIKKIKLLNVGGVAGISIFKKKTGLLNRPVFKE